jgi:hypothetical protein
MYKKFLINFYGIRSTEGYVLAVQTGGYSGVAYFVADPLFTEVGRIMQVRRGR